MVMGKGREGVGEGREKREREGRGKGWRTFVRLANFVFLIIHSDGFGAIFYFEDDFALAVHADVAVANEVHDERVAACLWRGLELHFESLHVEGWVAVVVEEGFIEGGHGEGWDGDFVEFTV